MTKCLLKKAFFGENFYHIEARSFRDRGKDYTQRQLAMTPLVEFCLPFHELKSIVDGMVDEENVLQIEYPVGDNYLQVSIPEDIRGADKFQTTTTIHLDTFAATHNLHSDHRGSSD